MIHSTAVAFVISIVALTSLGGCEDECSSYSPSGFNCKEIEKANYNVNFILPDNTELSLGKISGLSNCAAKASDYSKLHAVPKKYVCCMVTEASSCAEEHR